MTGSRNPIRVVTWIVEETQTFVDKYLALVSRLCQIGRHLKMVVNKEAAADSQEAMEYLLGTQEVHF